MKTLLLIVVLIFSSYISTASADQTGWYVGLGVGTGWSDLEQNDYEDGSLLWLNKKGAPFVPSFIVGNRFTEYISVEIGYIDFGEYVLDGKSDGTGSFWVAGPIKVTEKAMGSTLALIGYLPLGRRHIFNITGKAGFLNWDAKVELRDELGTVTEDDNGTSFFIGIGVNFDFFKKGSIRIDLDRYSIDFLDYDRVVTVATAKYVHYF